MMKVAVYLASALLAQGKLRTREMQLAFLATLRPDGYRSWIVPHWGHCVLMGAGLLVFTKKSRQLGLQQ